MSFGEQLKFYRNKAGMSQTELAKKLKVSRSTIGMYETGDREPSLEMMKKIAASLNIPLSLLVAKRGLVLRKTNEPDIEITEIQDEHGNIIGEDINLNTMLIGDKDHDSEVINLLEDFRTRPDMRMLFKLAHGATPEDVERAAKIIEALRK